MDFPLKLNWLKKSLDVLGDTIKIVARKGKGVNITSMKLKESIKVFKNLIRNRRKKEYKLLCRVQN